MQVRVILHRVRSPLLVLAALAAVWFVDHFFIPAHIPGTILYAIPIMLAAGLLSEPFALAIIAVSVALDVTEHLLAASTLDAVSIGAATLVVIGYLAIYLARQTRVATRTAEENRRLYEDVRRESEAAEQSRSEREAFVALVTHELRGILTVLSGHAQLLEREGVPESMRHKSVQALSSQVGRMRRLLGDLGDVSSMEQGRFRVEKRQCDLVSQARQAVREHQAVSGRHSLVLDSQVNRLEGEWDCDRLRQVLDNLIRNAIKYSPEGGEVRVAVRALPGEAELAVSDQGIGIAEEDIPKLFQPYSRAVALGRFEGLGLGLYITRGIVEAHGGHISVERRDGRGTTFRVVLPRSTTAG